MASDTGQLFRKINSQRETYMKWKIAVALMGLLTVLAAESFAAQRFTWAAAIHWFNDTPSSLASRWAAFLMDARCKSPAHPPGH